MDIEDNLNIHLFIKIPEIRDLIVNSLTMMDTCTVAFMLLGFVSGWILISTMIMELSREKVIDEHL